jgi:tripartite-type tricarboxylate transporter receptor subunit TctC
LRILDFFRILALAVGLLAGAAGAQETYPSQSVRVIVPFSAGGGTDIVTRHFAHQLMERLGKPFVVENKAGGAGGTVGGMELARARPDGNTIGTGTSSGVLSAAVDPGGFNPLKDLDPVARMGATTLMLVVNSQLPATTLGELIALAKTKPGLAYGSSGMGSANHFAGEMLARSAGVQMTHVPYRGESAALTDVVSGITPILFVSIAGAKPYVQSGQVRALAVTSEKRFPSVPDVPTTVELGFRDLVVEAFYGLYVPKGTPASIVDVLVRNVNAIRADPETSKRFLEQLSFDMSGSDNPRTFRAYMEKELARYARIADGAGLIGMKSK